MTVPVYLPYYVLAGSIGIIAALLFGLGKALNRAGWPAYQRSSGRPRVRRHSDRLVFLAIALAWMGYYRAAADRIPTIQYGVLTPILIGGWLIWRSPTIARIIDATPQHWLVGVQLYRALGASS